MNINVLGDRSYKAYKIFYKLTMRAIDTFTFVVSALLGLGMILYTVSYFISPKEEFADSIVVFAFFLVLLIVFKIFAPKLSYRFDKLDIKNGENITFTEKNFTVVDDEKNFHSETVFRYAAIDKAYETEDYIFLYISKGRAVTVNKKTAEGGTAEELRGFLIEKLGKKFKYKNIR